DRAARVAQRHHGSIPCPRDFPQWRRKWLIHRKRMIADHVESARNTKKQWIDSIVFDRRHLTVRRLHSTDRAAEFKRNPLMAQTHTEKRNRRAANHVSGNAKIARDGGMTRPRRNQNGIEIPRLN